MVAERLWWVPDSLHANFSGVLWSALPTGAVKPWHLMISFQLHTWSLIYLSTFGSDLMSTCSIMAINVMTLVAKLRYLSAVYSLPRTPPPPPSLPPAGWHSFVAGFQGWQMNEVKVTGVAGQHPTGRLLYDTVIDSHRCTACSSFQWPKLPMWGAWVVYVCGLAFLVHRYRDICLCIPFSNESKKINLTDEVTFFRTARPGTGSVLT